MLSHIPCGAQRISILSFSLPRTQSLLVERDDVMSKTLLTKSATQTGSLSEQIERMRRGGGEVRPSPT